MSFDALLNKTGTVRRFTSAGVSASGHEKSTWATVATGVKCRLQSRGGNEAIDDRTTSIENLVLFTKAATDTTEDDQWIIDSKTYEVKLVTDGGGAGHHKECVVKLVKA